MSFLLLKTSAIAKRVSTASRPFVCRGKDRFAAPLWRAALHRLEPRLEAMIIKR